MPQAATYEDDDDEYYSESEYSHTNRSYATSRATEQYAPPPQPPQAIHRDDDELSDYSYYSNDTDARTDDGPASTGAETGKRTGGTSNNSIVDWLSRASFIASSALSAAASSSSQPAAPTLADNVPTGLLYTPREAPQPRRRAGRMGAHGRIAAIPWREMVGLKESLLSQMDGTASAEERLDERAAVGLQYAAALGRAGTQIDEAIRELQQVSRILFCTSDWPLLALG